MKRLLSLIALLPLPALAAGPWFIDAETIDNQVRELVLYNSSDGGATVNTTLDPTATATNVRFCDNVTLACACEFVGTGDFELITTFGTRDTTIGTDKMQLEHRGNGHYEMQIPAECFDGVGGEQMTMSISGTTVFPMDVEIVLNAITLAEVETANRDAIDAEGVAREDTLNVLDGVADNILLDTDDLQASISDGLTLEDGAITSAKYAAGAIDAAAIAADAIGASELAADAVGASEVAAGAIDAGALASDTLTAAKVAADAGAELADATWDEVLAGHATAGTSGKALADAGVSAPPTVGEISDGVWDEAQVGHVTAGSFGEVATEVASILTDTGTTLDGKVDTIGTNVSAVLADTGTDGVAIADNSITAAKIATDAIGATEIAAGAIDASALATDASTELVAAVSAMIVDGTITLQQGLSLMLSRDIGPWDNDGDPDIGPYCYEDPTGAEDRFCVTLDGDESRTLDSTDPYAP